MIDLISIVSSVASILSLASQLSFKLWAYERAAISESYGGTTGFLISTFFGNTASEYERLERVILRGSDDEALRFRDSVTNKCNMTAVAGAIIAQVSLTALSLTDLSLAHWTARTFLLFATVAGCLSVYYACNLSRTIGKLYQPELVRDWLSATSQNGPQETGTGDEKARKASISAIFILSAPYTMMSYAIYAFIVGLAIYQGFVWTRNLDTDAGKVNNRNVFIAFMVSTGFCELFFAFAGATKAIEDLLLHDELRAKLVGPISSNGDLGGRRRDGETHFQLEEYPSETSENTAVAPIQNIKTASQAQNTANKDSSSGIVTALEAAARAHLLSAEADRRVALEYAKLSGPPRGSVMV